MIVASLIRSTSSFTAKSETTSTSRGFTGLPKRSLISISNCAWNARVAKIATSVRKHGFRVLIFLSKRQLTNSELDSILSQSGRHLTEFAFRSKTHALAEQNHSVRQRGRGERLE